MQDKLEVAVVQGTATETKVAGSVSWEGPALKRSVPITAAVGTAHTRGFNMIVFLNIGSLFE